MGLFTVHRNLADYTAFTGCSTVNVHLAVPFSEQAAAMVYKKVSSKRNTESTTAGGPARGGGFDKVTLFDLQRERNRVKSLCSYCK